MGKSTATTLRRLMVVVGEAMLGAEVVAEADMMMMMVVMAMVVGLEEMMMTEKGMVMMYGIAQVPTMQGQGGEMRDFKK